MNLLSLTAVELGKKIKAHEVSVEEATRAALDAIAAKEDAVHSFVTVDEEGAMKRAAEVQKLIDDGTLTGPLAGVPVAIKDNMCTKGMLTTCSSLGTGRATGKTAPRRYDAGRNLFGNREQETVKLCLCSDHIG